MWTIRLAMLSPLLATVAACTTYSTGTSRPIIPERDIRVQLTTPVALHFTCAEADSLYASSTPCVADSVDMPGVTELTGRVLHTKDDSVLVAVDDARDSTGHTRRFSPPQLTVLDQHLAMVQYRHTDTTRTAFLVVGIVAAVVGAVALVAAFSVWSNGGFFGINP